jgi:hypothetical protein
MTIPPLTKARLFQSFMAYENVKVVNHQPYSPDLSQSHIFLFPSLKIISSLSNVFKRLTVVMDSKLTIKRYFQVLDNYHAVTVKCKIDVFQSFKIKKKRKKK